MTNQITTNINPQGLNETFESLMLHFYLRKRSTRSTDLGRLRRALIRTGTIGDNREFYQTFIQLEREHWGRIHYSPTGIPRKFEWHYYSNQIGAAKLGESTKPKPFKTRAKAPLGVKRSVRGPAAHTRAINNKSTSNQLLANPVITNVPQTVSNVPGVTNRTPSPQPTKDLSPLIGVLKARRTGKSVIINDIELLFEAANVIVRLPLSKSALLINIIKELG